MRHRTVVSKVVVRERDKQACNGGTVGGDIHLTTGFFDCIKVFSARLLSGYRLFTTNEPAINRAGRASRALGLRVRIGKLTLECPIPS